MSILLCEKRKKILAQPGHLLVLGGPGAGKTTISLLKAKERIRALAPAQSVLFLSFSRAATKQILDRSTALLSRVEQESLQVQTYHAFCMDLLRTHGRLFTGQPAKFLYPLEERMLEADFDGDWKVERALRARDSNEFCFDLFADGAARLLERSNKIRRLISSKYPMVIADEFQDTDNDQWRIVSALSSDSDIFFLADPEQRIFDYRDDIDPLRIDKVKAALAPAEFDLQGENHRSPNSGILAFADAVLRNKPLPETEDVQIYQYRRWEYPIAVHATVVGMLSELRSKGVAEPTVVVLARSNALISEISTLIGAPRQLPNGSIPGVDHDVVWDADLSAAAAVAIASVLEWPSKNAADATGDTLKAIATYYRLKGAESPSDKSRKRIKTYEEAILRAKSGKPQRTKIGKWLTEKTKSSLSYGGASVSDWLLARRQLEDSGAVDDLIKDARLVRLFRATDALASGLSERWDALGSYSGAAMLVQKILESERVSASQRDPRQCTLMNMHKSKGKEFDGVVIVEAPFKGALIDRRTEVPPYERSRRLLRVAITRARALVVLVRPDDADALVDA